MNITIKEVLENLHKQLCQTEEETGRSLNKLIFFTLKKSVLPKLSDRTALLQRIKKRRDALDVWLDDDTLHAAIHESSEKI